MKKHIAVVSVPAHGHINPTLPLVEELTARGHRVSYATGAAMLETVEAAGADPVAVPSAEPNASKLQNGGQVTTEAMLTMMSFMREQIVETFPALEQHFRADPPDALCVDMMTVPGRMAADVLGVPEVGLLPSFAANEQFSLHSRMSERIDLTDPRIAEAQQEFTALAERFGANPDVVGWHGTPADTNVVFLPKRFQLAAETFDDRFHFIGPCLGRRAEQRYRPADPDAPLLFISLGTAFNNRPDIFRMCLEAFGDSGWQVAMSIGHRVGLDELGTIPGNVDVRPSFPQPGVLQQATAFLTHNGMGSTMEALHYGVPQAGLPQMVEQEANADRVAELGLGRRLDEQQLSPEYLRTQLDELVADEQVRANLAAMREHLRSAGGPAAGADVIEAAAGA